MMPTARLLAVFSCVSLLCVGASQRARAAETARRSPEAAAARTRLAAAAPSTTRPAGAGLAAGRPGASEKGVAPDAGSAEGPLVLRLPRPVGGEWFGLYILGKKAGYAFADVSAGTWAGKPAIVARSTITLRAAVGGVDAQRELSETRYYEALDRGRLVSFRVERRGDGGEEVLSGEVQGDGIALVRRRPGVPDEKRRIAATRETAEDADAARLVLATGKKHEGVTLDLEERLEDKKMTTEVIGAGSLVLAGVEVPVRRVRTVEAESQLPIVAAIAADGRVLEVKFGEVMVGKAEAEAVAKRLDQVDLFNLTRVKIDKPIPESARERRKAIVYEVRGLPEGFRRQSSWHTWTTTRDPGVLELAVTPHAPRKAAALPIDASGNEELRKALEPSLAVESQAPAIVERARRVVGAERDSWRAAKKLNHHVATTIAKAYGASNDRATGVLAAGKGDCTEHSLLMTALARAAGIPARRVDGLVYLEAADGVPAFYWHEWIEVYVGEWIAMDPTFDQDLADGTHLALGGEGRSDTAGLIGQLKISVRKIGAAP